MKKVLISLDDMIYILGCQGKTFFEGCLDSDFITLKYFNDWFDAQPDASEPDYGKHCNDLANHSGNACEGRMVCMPGLVCEKCGWESV